MRLPLEKALKFKALLWPQGMEVLLATICRTNLFFAL